MSSYFTLFLTLSAFLIGEQTGFEALQHCSSDYEAGFFADFLREFHKGFHESDSRFIFSKPSDIPQQIREQVINNISSEVEREQLKTEPLKEIADKDRSSIYSKAILENIELIADLKKPHLVVKDYLVKDFSEDSEEGIIQRAIFDEINHLFFLRSNFSLTRKEHPTFFAYKTAEAELEMVYLLDAMHKIQRKELNRETKDKLIDFFSMAINRKMVDLNHLLLATLLNKEPENPLEAELKEYLLQFTP